MSQKAIQNRRFSQALVLFIFKIMTNRISQRWLRHPSSVVFVTSNLCIKSTPFTSLAEAEAMRFIPKSTKIPVPKVYLAFERKKKVYIVMERLPGQSLSVG